MKLHCTYHHLSAPKPNFLTVGVQLSKHERVVPESHWISTANQVLKKYHQPITLQNTNKIPVRYLKSHIGSMSRIHILPTENKSAIHVGTYIYYMYIYIYISIPWGSPKWECYHHLPAPITIKNFDLIDGRKEFHLILCKGYVGALSVPSVSSNSSGGSQQ